jgi:pimeloyl-ACP methyl ester carboxylesterase
MSKIDSPSRLLAPDLPCFGDTPQDVIGTSAYIDSCVDWLIAFLSAVGVAEPVVLVGTSMGGYIAASFAAKHPGRVRYLLLLAPAGAIESEAFPAEPQTQIVAGVHPLLPTSWEQYQDMVKLLAHKPLPIPLWMLKGLWTEAEPRTSVFQAILRSLVDSITRQQVLVDMHLCSPMFTCVEMTLGKCMQVQSILCSLPDTLPIGVGWGANDSLLPVNGVLLLRASKPHHIQCYIAALCIPAA